MEKTLDTQNPEPDSATSPPMVAPSPMTTASPRIDGVVIGRVVGHSADGSTLVGYGKRMDEGQIARNLSANAAVEGQWVALMFEGGDPEKPLIMGPVVEPPADHEPQSEGAVDPETLVLKAKKKVVLKCGKASLTLTKSGKVILRGAYISSRSSGTNRLRGASVQIN